MKNSNTKQEVRYPIQSRNYSSRDYSREVKQSTKSFITNTTYEQADVVKEYASNYVDEMISIGIDWFADKFINWIDNILR